MLVKALAAVFFSADLALEYLAVVLPFADPRSVVPVPIVDKEGLIAAFSDYPPPENSTSSLRA